MSPSAAARRVALYSHDTQGLGHIRRNVALAAALVDSGDTDVLLITGSPAASALPLPPRTDLVTLPAARKDVNGDYHSRSLTLPVDDLLRLRSELIMTAVTSFEPDLVVVDKVPRGLRGELLPTLTALRHSDTRVVLGLRDVLDAPAATRRDWLRDESTETIERHYDAVWVYGDPQVFDPASVYGWPDSVTAKITYTGYLARGRFRRSGDGSTRSDDPTVDSEPPVRTPEPGYLLGQVGGGQDGHALAAAFIEAVAAADRRGVLLTGPLMATSQLQHLRQRARDADVTLIDFHPDPIALLAGATGVISMAGYNSVCELLDAQAPTLLVPRVRPRAEQLVRAESLSAHGLVDLLPPDELSSAALAAWVSRLPDTAPAQPRGRPGPPTPVDLDGLSRIAGLADALIGRIHHAA